MEIDATQAVPFLTTQAELTAFLDTCDSGDLCCVDTEADSLYSFREKVCLIQFACGERLALIDPLTISDMSPLLDFLEASPEVWMHGADYDMSILNRTYDRVPGRVYDTQIAARLAGWRTFGLAHLISESFGLELSKQSQKKNWGERPLPHKMLEYAANDVRYILPLAQIFKDKLDSLGRWDWFLQSCDAARVQVMARKEKSREESWRISGWGKLKPRSLGYLRALWRWRDEIAERRDKPPFKILANDQLLKMSLSLTHGDDVQLPPRFRTQQRRRFEEMVKEAKELPDGDLPIRLRGKRLAKAEDWEPIFGSLKANREKAAAELDLEVAIISSKASMETFAFAEPKDRTDELRNQLFLPWQRALLFPS